MTPLLRRAVLRLRRAVRSHLIGKPCREKRAECPICHEPSSLLQYKHREFRHTRVHICASCGHGYTDRDFVVTRSGLWSANRQRADYYMSEVFPAWVQNYQGKRFLEIGACDFYLLSKLRSSFPGLSLYAYDKYPKGPVPDEVGFVDDLRDLPRVNYVLMLHTLEHIYDLDALSEQLRQCLASRAILIVEVPNNSMRKHREVQAGRHITGYHFHFFNESSLRQKISEWGFEPLMIRSYGPHKWDLEGINLLGVFQFLDRQSEDGGPPMPGQVTADT